MIHSPFCSPHTHASPTTLLAIRVARSFSHSQADSVRILLNTPMFWPHKYRRTLSQKEVQEDASSVEGEESHFLPVLCPRKHAYGQAACRKVDRARAGNIEEEAYYCVTSVLRALA